MILSRASSRTSAETGDIFAAAGGDGRKRVKQRDKVINAGVFFMATASGR